MESKDLPQSDLAWASQLGLIDQHMFFLTTPISKPRLKTLQWYILRNIPLHFVAWSCDWPCQTWESTPGGGSTRDGKWEHVVPSLPVIPNVWEIFLNHIKTQFIYLFIQCQNRPASNLRTYYIHVLAGFRTRTLWSPNTRPQHCWVT